MQMSLFLGRSRNPLFKKKKKATLANVHRILKRLESWQMGSCEYEIHAAHDALWSSDSEEPGDFPLPPLWGSEAPEGDKGAGGGEPGEQGCCKCNCCSATVPGSHYCPAVANPVPGVPSPHWPRPDLKPCNLLPACSLTPSRKKRLARRGSAQAWRGPLPTR